MTSDDDQFHQGSVGALMPLSSPSPQALFVSKGARIISMMAGDAVSRLKSPSVRIPTKTWRVGDFAFCRDDYEQLLRWVCSFTKENGPRTVDDLVSEFQMRFMEYAEKELNYQSWVVEGRITFAYLMDWGIELLDLSGVPALTELYCSFNNIAELDLSRAHALTKLACNGNQLTDLDLSRVSALTALGCFSNQLTELDLPWVPALTRLVCRKNQLTELDLSAVPALTRLDCSNNQLTELDISAAPALTELVCHYNQLTELDLSRAPALTTLDCSNNRLTYLDIRPCKFLDEVSSSPSVQIIKRPDQVVIYAR